MRTLIVLVLLIGTSFRMFSQVLFSQKDVEIFNSIIAEAKKKNLSDSSLNKIVITVGKQLIGTTYVGGVLDKPEMENLVVDLSALDCVTFLESTVSISLAIKKNKLQFDDFCNQLQFLRYRDGIMNGYASRLHYFYDWITNNQQKGLVHNITSEIGGLPYVKTINFMTSNPTKYSHLNNDSAISVIKKVEDQLNSSVKFYIPKENILNVETKIKDGDLIALTTTIPGIEISHVGIAIHQDGRLHFMHASSVSMKVEISEKPLFEMLQNNKRNTGIVVARLNYD